MECRNKSFNESVIQNILGDDESLSPPPQLMFKNAFSINAEIQVKLELFYSHNSSSTVHEGNHEFKVFDPVLGTGMDTGSTFGSLAQANVPTFGSLATSPTSNFGSIQQQQSGFGTLAASQNVGFGQLSPQNQQSVFGQSSFGSQGGFDQSHSPGGFQQQQQPGFGSSSSSSFG